MFKRFTSTSAKLGLMAFGLVAIIPLAANWDAVGQRHGVNTASIIDFASREELTDLEDKIDDLTELIIELKAEMIRVGRMDAEEMLGVNSEEE